MMIDPVFLEKLSKYELLKCKLNHVFNRNVSFILNFISDEAKTLPIENLKFIEIEIEFEIQSVLSMSEITDRYATETTLNDYMFLEPRASNLEEFIACLHISPRNTAIIKTIINYRKQRNRDKDMSMPKPSFFGISIIDPNDLSVIH